MTNEYIPRDTLDKWLDLTLLAQGTVAGKAYVRMFWDKVRSIPAADVVSVVRCKDCVHRLQGGYCKTIVDGRVTKAVNDNFFCGYGDRRADNDR